MHRDCMLLTQLQRALVVAQHSLSSRCSMHLGYALALPLSYIFTLANRSPMLHDVCDAREMVRRTLGAATQVDALTLTYRPEAQTYG